MSGIGVIARVDDGAVVVQLAFHQGNPFVHRIISPFDVAHGLVVAHKRNQSGGYVAGIGGGAVAADDAEVRLQHQGAVAHERSHGFCFGVRIAGAVGQRHVCPVVGMSQSLRRDGCLRGGRRIGRQYAFAACRPLVVAHGDGKCRGGASGVGFLTVNHRAELVVGCLLVPVGRLQFYHNIPGAGVGPSPCDGFFGRCTAAAQVVDFAAHVVEPVAQVGWQGALREFFAERIAQDRAHQVVARHDDEAAARRVVEDVIGGSRTVGAGQDTFAVEHQLEGRRANSGLGGCLQESGGHPAGFLLADVSRKGQSGQ